MRGEELPDANDLPFLEVAHAAGALLVTGNLKHYPERQRQEVEVLDPATFLEAWLDQLRDRHSEPGDAGV